MENLSYFLASTVSVIQGGVVLAMILSVVISGMIPRCGEDT